MPAETSWYFLPVALLLGALHGLEPGHSKTMMAAFLIAIHGTVRQAVLLGLAATVSHTALIWALAAAALAWREELTAETVAPYLHIVSGTMVLGLAAWVAWRTRRAQPASSPGAQDHHHEHHDHHHHGHSHGDHTHSHEHDHPHAHPHHGNHDDGQQHHHHGHAHTHEHASHAAATHDEDDAHTLAHAAEMRAHLAGRTTLGNGQILLFGLSGGLLPCPGALAVLLLCLQAGRATLGFGIVLAFSLGLAATLVTVGVLAALGAQAARKRLPQFNRWAARAPYFSAGFLFLLGGYFLAEGLLELG